MLGNQSICDYVMPIVSLYKDANVNFMGTCFLIKDNLYAMTCKHVVDNDDELYVLARDKDKWIPVKIVERILNENEDAAIIKLEDSKDVPKDTFLKISGSAEHSSCDYMQWAYPEDVVMEMTIDSKAVSRPDLVFLKGYIRRRFANFDNSMLIKGSLYELSEVGISGCSGSPIIRTNRPGDNNAVWNVIGIYCSSRATEIEGYKVQVGYAVRTATVYEWITNIIS